MLSAADKGGEAMSVSGWGVEGGSLYLPLNFAVNLKLLYKNKVLLKTKPKSRYWRTPPACSVLVRRHLKPVYGSEHIRYSTITSLGGKHPERVELSSATQGYYEELAVLGLDKEILLRGEEQTSLLWAPDL